MHNFPNHIYVTVKNVTLPQAKTILKLCIDNELNFDSDLITNPIWEISPHYYYNNDDNAIGVVDTVLDNGDMVVNFKEFCNYIKGVGRQIKPPYKKEIELSSQYKAIVTKENVKVGCQTFSHEVIKQLYESSVESQK